MARWILTPLVIFGVLLGWIWVQGVYARFATRHPELGPYREEGGGCGGGCCSGRGHCERD
jgi:hypothetical protein